MKTRNIKISRHKIPNLTHHIQNNNKTKVKWPTFFSKIQNSLKLLEEPMSLDPDRSKDNKKKSNGTFMSLRLSELAKHRQRFTSLNSSNYGKSSDEAQTVRNRTIEDKIRPFSLPRMGNPYGESGRSKSIDKEKYNKNGSNNDGVQEIASNGFFGKGYEDIVQLLEDEKQRNKKRQVIKSEEGSQGEQKQTMTLHQNKSENEIDQNLVIIDASFTELSERIGRDLHAKFQSYDRKLMEKIKIYRPKKFNFSHQVTWK